MRFRCGKPGVECHVRHTSSAAVVQLLFLINEVRKFGLQSQVVLFQSFSDFICVQAKLINKVVMFMCTKN